MRRASFVILGPQQLRIINRRENLTSREDRSAVTMTFVHNGFEVIQEASLDRETSTYSYHAAGRLIQSTDGRGQVIDYPRLP